MQRLNSDLTIATATPLKKGRTPFLRRTWVRVLVALVLLVVIAIGGLAAFILSGPIDVGFVRAQLANSIRSSLGEAYDVEIATATLDNDPVLGLVLIVDGVTLRDSQSTIVAEVPSVRLGINPFGFVLPSGVVRSVEVTGAKLAFVRSAEGRVQFGPLDAGSEALRRGRPNAAANETPDGGFPDLVAALQILDRGIEPAISAAEQSGFRLLTLADTTIEFRDLDQSTLKTFSRTDLSVALDPARGEASVVLSSWGYSGRWSATAERTVEPRSGDRIYSVDLAQLSLGDLFWSIAEPGSPLSSDVPLYGRANVRLAADGSVEEASLRLDLGSGEIRARSDVDPIRVDEATLKLRWDVPGGRILIEPSTVFFGETRGVFTGAIRSLGEGRYDFDIESRGAVLAQRDSPAPPLVTQRIVLAGSADLEAKLVEIRNAMVLTPTGSFAAAGSIGFDGETPSLALAASFSPMPVDTLKQLWPPFLADGARRWVQQNVRTGRVVSGRIDVAIPAGLLWTGQRPEIPADALKVDFQVEGVSFSPLPGLPPVVGSAGHLALAGSTFGLDLAGGTITVPSGRRVDLVAAAFAIPNTAPVPPDAQVVAQLSGEAAALAEIADSPPFLALAKRGIAPATFSGRGQASVSAGWPLRPDVAPEEIDWQVNARLANFASSAPLEGHRVAEANVTLNINPQTLFIRGAARVDGVMADLNMTQPLTAGAPATDGLSQLRFVVGEETRDLFANGLGDILAGTISAAITDLDGRAGEHFELDLAAARLTLAPLGWSKGVGVPARLSFDLVPIANGFRVEAISLIGSGFGLTGTAELDSAYELRSANVRRVALRSGDDFALTLARQANGYRIGLSGRSFDVRGMMAEVRGDPATGPSSGGIDIQINGTIGRLIGFQQEVVTDASVAIDFRGGTVREFRLSGALGGAPLSVAYSDNLTTAGLDIAAADGGRAFRFIDLYGHIVGGALRITGQRPNAEAPLAGTYDLTNFHIFNEPAMASLFNAAAVQGSPTANNTNNIEFDRMVVTFAKYGSVIAMGEGLLKGDLVGAVFDGNVDTSGARLNLSGTYLPSYRLNNFFGQIPLFGLILGGGAREGLLGVTFKIEGTMDAPLLTVNALSAIAPGIFRKLFEFQ